MTTRRAKVLGILHRIAEGQSVSIQGAPGIGKTHVLQCIASRLAADSRCRIVVSNAALLSRGSQLFDEISGAEARYESKTIREAFNSARRAVELSSDPIVFMVDDFDAICDMADADETLRYLSVLLDTVPPRSLSLCFLSRRALIDLELKLRGISRLAFRCHGYYLGPLGLEDILVDSTWSTAAASAGATALSRCISDTVGHPSLVETWLVDHNGHDFADYLTTVFLRLVRYLGLIERLDACAQIVCGPLVDQLYLERRDLERLGFVSADSDRDAVCFSLHPAFVEVLEHETRSLNAWGVLGKAEIQSRRVIENCLGSEYGPSWAAVVAASSPALETVYKSALRSLQREARVFGSAGGWLDYTYPRDLWAIISKYWHLFARIFPSGDQAYWRQRFEGLATLRGPLAHHRSLTEDEKSNCKRWARQIVLAIDQSGAVALT